MNHSNFAEGDSSQPRQRDSWVVLVQHEVLKQSNLWSKDSLCFLGCCLMLGKWTLPK